jgi:transcriptional regulator
MYHTHDRNRVRGIMGTDEGRLLQGTLDVLVLNSLIAGPRHWYAVSTWIRDKTGGALDIEDGALYTALHRLEKRQLLAAEWGISDTNRKVKVYQLTDAGQRQLEKRSRIWNEYADAVSRVLESG